MCGRFLLDTPSAELARALELAGVSLSPRLNIAPTQPIIFVRAGPEGREAATGRWGLVPPWSKDPRRGPPLINARAETAASKPAFREAFRRRRALIPASGFYEWQRRPEGKQAYALLPKAGSLLVFAGLWERWGEEDPVTSCAILTTTPNATLAGIHDRMPVILGRRAAQAWLDPQTPRRELEALLRPCPESWLEARPVSSYVNRVGNEGPRCLEPAAPSETPLRDAS